MYKRQHLHDGLFGQAEPGDECRRERAKPCGERKWAWGHGRLQKACGGEQRKSLRAQAVSYTHLDVYKRQLLESTGQYGENVGVVEYDGETFSGRLIPAAEYAGSDETVAALVNGVDAEVQEQLSAVFASTEVDLNGEREPGVRTEETNLGDFASDAILWQAQQSVGDQVVAAVTNGGGIRASIPAGDISMNDMKTVFPYGNMVVTFTVTGAELLEALEAATAFLPASSGAFPQVAGIVFTVDTSVEYVNGEMCIRDRRNLHGLPLRQHAHLPPKEGHHEIPVDHEPRPRKWRRAGHHARYAGRRYHPWRHHLLPPAGQQLSLIHI